MVIRSKELNRGYLLERILSPVHIGLENGKLLGLARVYVYGDSDLTVAYVAPQPNRLLKLVVKVLGNLGGYRKKRVVSIKNRTALYRATVGICHNVHIAVVLIALDREGYCSMEVLRVVISWVKADVLGNSERVHTAVTVVTVEGRVGSLIGIYLDILCRERIALDVRFLKERIKGGFSIGINSLTEVELGRRIIDIQAGTDSAVAFNIRGQIRA